jgi:signal peptidase I
MTMPRRDDPFEERPEEEQQQEDGWYFDLPSGAWDRTRQVHRQLREQLLQGEGRREEKVERDPFTGLPVEKPKGLFGRFRRRKPRLPEDLERELKIREQQKRGKRSAEEGDWSTEGAAFAIDRLRDEAPLIVRPTAPPPPPPEPETEAPVSRWEQIFGGVEETESPLEAMRRWARGERLGPAEPSIAEEPPRDEDVGAPEEAEEEPDPIIEFMSHELARRARARWEQEHPAEPLATFTEESEGEPEEEHAPEREPLPFARADEAAEAQPPRQMRWEDAFGKPASEEEGFEAMRRWARGEPLAHGAGWERFESRQAAASDREPDEPRPVDAPPAEPRRRSVFGRLFGRGGQPAPEPSVETSLETWARETEPAAEAEAADEEGAGWAPVERNAQAPAWEAAGFEDSTDLEWQTEVVEVPAEEEPDSVTSILEEEGWSWDPEPVPQLSSELPTGNAAATAAAETPSWEAWDFDAETAHSEVAAEEPPRAASSVEAPDSSEPAVSDWSAGGQASRPSAPDEGADSALPLAWDWSDFEAEGADATAEAEARRSTEEPEAATPWEWFEAAVQEEPAAGPPQAEPAAAGEERQAGDRSWWDVFDTATGEPTKEAPSAGEWEHSAPPERDAQAPAEPAAAAEAAPSADTGDELLAAWDQIAAESGVDPSAPPPPPIRSSAFRRPSPWEMAGRHAETPPGESAVDEADESGPASAREEPQPAAEEPVWVPAESEGKDEEDIILKAFEAHAAAAPEEAEAEPAPVSEGRRRLSLRDLLGEDADDLLAAADEADEPVSFAQTHGWMPQSASGRLERDEWTPVGFESEATPFETPVPTEAETAQSAPRRRVNWVREVVEIGLMAVLLFLCIRATFQNFQVDGTSMYPTLVDGEFLLVNKLAYQTIDLERLSTFLPFIDPGDDGKVYVFGPPQRGDIVVFRDPTNPSVDLIKRIIALPGEKVEIADGKVYINDRLLEEPYVQGQWFGDRPAAIVPQGHYFVLGDNRDNSKDSRSPQIGYVPEDLIIGKAIITLWPRDRFGLAPNDGGRLLDEAPSAQSARHVD